MTEPAWADRPAADEYAPFYAGYVARVPEGPLPELLEAQLPDLFDALDGVDESRAGHRYAPDRWSIRQVVGHLSDTERVMAYRLLRVARGDATTSLPGFDENAFVAGANYDARSFTSLVDEWATCRRSTLALLNGLDPAVSTHRGLANGTPISARALACVLYGHVAHHLALLRERYGVA